MSNIHQIFKDLNWLAGLFNYRWEFLYCNASYKGRVSDYINTHQKGKAGAHYTPIGFNLIRSDFEQTIQRKLYSGNDHIETIQGVYVYSEPDTLYHPSDEPHPLFITMGSHSTSTIEIKKVKV